MKVRFKRLDSMAHLPLRATDGSAAYDLTASKVDLTVTTVGDNIVYTVHTGLAVEIPEGYVGLVFPRSSVVKTSLLLSNCVGVIDSDYRGEIMAKFYLLGNDGSRTYIVGERCMQLMILPVPTIEWEEADELTETSRGNGGYGSTGR